jgi:hypothetical protein
MKNLCIDGRCSHLCGQGECLGAVNASRSVFWLPPLHDTDGGHRVSGDDSLHLDPAPATPDDALGWLFCLICTAMFAIACFVAIALMGVPLVYPFA